jgi:hypothetical protein
MPPLNSCLNLVLIPNNSKLQDSPDIKHTLERVSYTVNYWGLPELTQALLPQLIDINNYFPATSPSIPEPPSRNAFALFALKDAHCPELTQPVLGAVNAIHPAGTKNLRPPITDQRSCELNNTRRIPIDFHYRLQA